MDLLDLSLFHLVAEQGSFSRAAAATGLSQPSVSARLAALEVEVGQVLFERTKRGATLTEAGEVLRPFVERGLALADEAQKALSSVSSVPRLSIASPPLLATRVLLPVIEQLGSQVTLHSHTGHSSEVRQMVLDGVAQAGFVLAGPEHAHLKQELLFEDAIVAVVGPDHPLAGQSCTLADVVRFPLAPYDFGKDFDELERRLQAAGRPAAGVRRLHSTTARALALESGYLTWLPSIFISEDLKQGKLITVTIEDLPQWCWPVALIYREHKRPDRGLALLLELLERHPLTP